MCDNLYLRGYVKEGFKESVLKREAHFINIVFFMGLRYLTICRINLQFTRQSELQF